MRNADHNNITKAATAVGRSDTFCAVTFIKHSARNQVRPEEPIRRPLLQQQTTGRRSGE